MHELIAFLTARYDEAEALARAAGGEGPEGQWARREDESGTEYGHLRDGRDSVVVYDEGAPGGIEFDHIAANDPAHRLADIALKRAILAEYVSFREERAKGDVGPGLHTGTQVLGDVVRQLGTEFAGHPDYDESWKP